MAGVRAILGAAILALGVFFVARSASAAPFDPGGRDWEGYADFVALSREALGTSLIVTSRLDLSVIHPKDALVLVHPEKRLDVEGVASFLSSGGRVVLLDDFGTGDRLLRRFAIQRVPLSAAPLEALRHNPELAIAEPVGDSEIVRDVVRVVTNHAMGLAHPGLTPLLEVRTGHGDGGVLALVGQASEGKLVVVGDPSILMNSMLHYPGNRQLADNLVRFVGRPGGKVYVCVGAFETTGTFRGDPAPGGLHDVATPLLFDALTGLGPKLTQLLGAFIGLGVVVWVGSIAGRTYRISRPRLTRIIPLFTQGGAAGHAALVGARGTRRDAAMVEIGRALEEELAHELGLPRVPLPQELVGRLAAAGLLARASGERLEKLLTRIGRIDLMVGAGRGDALSRPGDDDVLAAADVAAKIRREVFSHASHAKGGRAA